MEPQTRRILDILEREVRAICADEGVECTDLSALLIKLERHEASVRELSAPVAEALRSLLSLRRDLLAVHVRGQR